MFYSILSVSGQDLSKKYIKLPKQDLSVEGYLQLIEKNTGFKLLYSSAIIEDGTFKIQKDSIRINELLDILFVNHPVKPVVRDKLLILAPQAEVALKDKKIKVSGSVLDMQTKKPVPFASVFVPNKSIGTITNNDGIFEVFLPEDLKIDTLMVSCLGFYSEKIPSKTFLEGHLDIFLNSNKFIAISQVIVRPKNPRALVLKAINKIPVNYSNKPVLLTAFFREASLQDNKYISLSEAIIDIYKTSYSDVSEDMIKLKKGRKGSNARNSFLVNLVVQGGLYYNLQLDIIKNGVSFLDPDEMYNYEYTFDKQTTYGGRHTYIVNFKFYENQHNIGYDGKIYIDAATFGIVRSEFEISPYCFYYAREIMVKNIPLGYQVKPKFGKYEVEYRLYDGCWNLMHCQSEIGFTVKSKQSEGKNAFSCEFTSNSEFVVTRKETEGYERIRYKEAAKPKDILYEQISETDVEFWGNETTIIPEEPLLETIEKLKLHQNYQKSELVSTKASEK